MKAAVQVLRRISLLLLNITDERQFPKEKRKEAADLDKWGTDAAKVSTQGPSSHILIY